MFSHSFVSSRERLHHCLCARRFGKKMSSDTWTDKMTVSDFKMWSEISLKRYLSVRKKNVDGDFEALVYGGKYVNHCHLFYLRKVTPVYF